MIRVSILLAVFLAGCSVVGPQQRAVRVTLGTASDDVKGPGVYLWVPFITSMAKLDVTIQKSEIEASAASKDMQEIQTHVAVNWSIDPAKVVETYKNIGYEDDVLERILRPAVNEAFKAAISKNTAEEVLSRRMELKKEIDSTLVARLGAYGIHMNDVSIVNLTFSKEFTDAIEAKQIAEQKAQQAKYDAQKAIEDAKATVNLARGEMEAQRLVKETITPALLQKLAIEKWNGEFPQVMGSGQVPFLNVSLREAASKGQRNQE